MYTPNLQHLDLSYNSFKTIPHQISLLKHLKSLNLAHNYLINIDGLTSPHLRTLNLESNRISSINLPQLINYINLSSNKFKSLLNIHAGSSIETFKIGNNLITEIPKGYLNKFTSLKTFDAQGNELCSVAMILIQNLFIRHIFVKNMSF